jgi:transposase-like protein
MTLTKEQKESYIASSGTSCPYCDSENTLIVDVDLETPGEIHAHGRCLECKNDWHVIYRLAEIKEADEE